MDRYLTNVNTIVQSLLISNVIVCGQNVRLSLEHKPEGACTTVWCQMLLIIYKGKHDVRITSSIATDI